MNNPQNIQLRKYDAASTEHSHDFYQWVLPIQGVLEIEINKKGGCVSSNQAAFIQPGETHCFASHNENEFLILESGADHRWMSTMKIPTFWKLTPALQNYLRFVKTYLMQPTNEGLSEALVRDFLLKLLAQHFLSPFDKKILLAKNWIDEHFAEPIDITKVAQVSCLSNSQLQRRFQRALGQTVGKYWRTIRLQQAQFHLKIGCESIEQIALRVGYESLATFSRSFSDFYGMSASEWQRDSNCKKVAP